MKSVMRPVLAVILAFLLGGCAHLSSGYKPASGMVPDEETAIRIAEAIWIPIYGKEVIEGEKPFVAKLENDVWTVTGTLPEGFNGGTAVAKIRKIDGRILYVLHGK